MISRVSTILASLLVVGCSTSFKETHYFKSDVSTAGAIPNYFRLTVEGGAAMSSARYVSGYFDEDTINAYFNEYTQPKGAALYPAKVAAPETGDAPANDGSSAKEAKGATPAAGKVQPVASGLQGTKLVMILSSNSDEVASQIGALAASKQFTASLAGLVARDRFVEADATEQQLLVDQSRAKTTAALGESLLAAIPATGASAQEAERQLLVLASSIARELGFDGSFADLNAVAQWLGLNRARLQGLR